MSTTSRRVADGDSFPELLGLVAGLPPSLRERIATHPSFAADRSRSYERLEFLGDSVLELAIAQMLYESFPDSPEGQLTKIRAHVVSRSSCAIVGRKLDLAAGLRERGRGLVSDDELERLATNRNVVSALLEAALGACYLTYGFDRVRGPIVAAFGERIEYALTTHVDHKTKLQEELARLGLQVVYALRSTEGPPHARSFTTAALVGGEAWGIGTGPSKKASEQAAAMEALARIAGDGDD